MSNAATDDPTDDPTSDPASDPAGCGSCVGRRTVLTAAAAAVGGIGLGTGVGTGLGTGPASATAGSWVTVCRTRAVPVGDGFFFSLYGQPWVVTQPVAGTFKGFSARCSHEGGTCNDIVQRAIQCPRHGSRFSVRTGLVVRGPATAGLTTVRVRVDGRRVQMRF